MPLLRFVILKQSTDQRVGVSFVAEDEDELEYGAQRPALARRCVHLMLSRALSLTLPP